MYVVAFLFYFEEIINFHGVCYFSKQGESCIVQLKLEFNNCLCSTRKTTYVSQ